LHRIQETESLANFTRQIGTIGNITAVKHLADFADIFWFAQGMLYLLLFAHPLMM